MNQGIKFTYNEAKSKCIDSGGKLAEPSENDNEELKSFQVFISMFLLDTTGVSLCVMPFRAIASGEVWGRI